MFKIYGSTATGFYVTLESSSEVLRSRNFSTKTQAVQACFAFFNSIMDNATILTDCTVQRGRLPNYFDALDLKP